MGSKTKRRILSHVSTVFLAVLASALLSVFRLHYNNLILQESPSSSSYADAPVLGVQPAESKLKPLFGPNHTKPFIYRRGSWDVAPIVIEKYKLIFFTQGKVACTVFKQLFRRMMNLTDWNVRKEPNLPHNPAKNGLTYLYDYKRSQALSMMTEPDWTRAIFIREPKERFVSAYLDKAARKEGLYVYRHCCYGDVHRTCAKKAYGSFEGFVEVVTTQCCCDHHWMPQWKRIDEPFWEHINFIGRFESLEVDTRRLLDQLGLWEEYGANGWGPNGTSSIFASTTSAKHKTDAGSKVHLYFQTPEIEALIESFYGEDYKKFNFTRKFIAS